MAIILVVPLALLFFFVCRSLRHDVAWIVSQHRVVVTTSFFIWLYALRFALTSSFRAIGLHCLQHGFTREQLLDDYAKDWVLSLFCNNGFPYPLHFQSVW